MAKYLKAEAPKPPEVDFKPSGHWKRWMKSRLCVNACNTHLWYSFLQTKRAALPLSASMVLTTYEKHRAAMEIKDPIDDETHDIVMSQLQPIIQTIRGRLVDEYRITDSLEDETGYVASTKACWESSRADGGAIGHLRSSAGLDRYQPGHVVHFQEGVRVSRRGKTPDLVRMHFYPVAVVNGSVRYNYVHEDYEFSDGQKLWSSYIQRFKGVDRRLNCTIQAVLEPLKVRVISKGEAGPYYFSKRLQKALHGIMRRMPCFRLIGKPLTAEDLIGLQTYGPDGGNGRFEWFSIDYSAATDGLSARLSKSILTSLVQNFPEELRRTFLSVLAPHTCHYPVVDGVRLDPVEQANGQLMGSILSFPVLCLANLGLYLAVTRNDCRDPLTRSRGVLVNGDDMLYVARESHWREHVEFGRKVGLVMSPGKAYHHPTVANANSMCFHYPIGVMGAKPRYIPYLNAGLYFGQGKVMGGDDVSEKRSITGVINELMTGCLPSRRANVLRDYLARHRDAVKRETQVLHKGGVFTRNLFIHESLGGLGVKPVEGFHFRVTDEQKRVAYQIWASNDNLSFDSEEEEIVTLENSIHAPWLAPSQESRWRFPGLGEGHISEANCLKGAKLVRVARTGRSASLTQKKATKLSDEYDFDDLAENNSLEMVRNSYIDWVSSRNSNSGMSLQALCMAQLEGGIERNRIFLRPETPYQRAHYFVGDWNAKYGKELGGKLLRPAVWYSGDDARALALSMIHWQ